MSAESGASTPAPRVSHPLHNLKLAEPHVNPAPEDDLTALAAMRAGKPYLAGDAYLDKLRNHALALLQKGNMELDMGRRMAMWRDGLLDLRPGPRGRCFIAAPFLCEYVSAPGSRSWSRCTTGLHGGMRLPAPEMGAAGRRGPGSARF